MKNAIIIKTIIDKISLIIIINLTNILEEIIFFNLFILFQFS